MHYLVADFPLVGTLHILGHTDGRVLACSYSDLRSDQKFCKHLDGAEFNADHAALEPFVEQLQAYLTGQRSSFDSDLDLSLLSDFQRKVLTTLATEVPFGQIVSYAKLAGLVGSPNSSRAVGRALATNPLCIVLPCHRVVASDGRLTGYAGGLRRKAALLDLESGVIS